VEGKVISKITYKSYVG